VFSTAKVVLREIEIKEGILPKLSNKFPVDSPAMSGAEDKWARASPFAQPER
jgi:hypothetical protein